jgi:hypothetical protein
LEVQQAQVELAVTAVVMTPGARPGDELATRRS